MSRNFGTDPETVGTTKFALKPGLAGAKIWRLKKARARIGDFEEYGVTKDSNPAAILRAERRACLAKSVARRVQNSDSSAATKQALGRKMTSASAATKTRVGLQLLSRNMSNGGRIAEFMYTRARHSKGAH